MNIYERLRAVPDEAKKPITAGRLKGFTDINPMWRIKRLTEVFGTYGIGWRYEITSKQLEQGANGTIAAFVDIKLYVKLDGEWGEPAFGTGGAMFVAKERDGLYTSDECFKMALTDAISVATKAFGLGADVYFEKDRSKYDGTPCELPIACAHCGAVITPYTDGSGKTISAKKIAAVSQERFNLTLCVACAKKKSEQGE